MQDIIQFINEYKGIALHNSRKSIGCPDGIEHNYKEGFIELDYDSGNCYAFIYNKKKNLVLFGESGDVHREIFNEYKDTDKGDEIGLNKISDTRQLRYTGPMYDSWRGEYKAKDKMSEWYEENKAILKELCEGRIWYFSDGIKYELGQYDEDWIEDHEKEVESFDSINKNVRAYIAFWNDLPAGKFKEYCDNIIKLFNAERGKDVKIVEYVAVGNNGEALFMNINEAPKQKITKRSKQYQNEVDQVWKYHADVTAEGRAKKRKLMTGYIKSRNAHFQKERYDKTDSKTAAEFHHKYTKRYDHKSGKMVWGEKIGDSLQMKTINDIISESSDNDTFTLQFTKEEMEILYSKIKATCQISMSVRQKIEALCKENHIEAK